MIFHNLFYYAGKVHSKYPLIIISFMTLVLLLSTFGIFQLEITNDPDDLWVTKNSKLSKMRDEKFQTFGKDFRIESLFLKPRDTEILEDKNFNIIQKKYLEEIYYLEKLLKEKKIEYKNNQYGFKDLCWTAFIKGNCVSQSPMNYWQGNLKRMLKDDDLEKTINCEKTVDPKQNIACMDANKLPVLAHAVFGGITKIKQSGISCGYQFLKKKKVLKKSFFGDIQEKKIHELKNLGENDDPCERYKITAKTLNISYLLNNESQKTIEIAEKWELEIAEKFIKEFNSSETTSFFKKYFPKAKIDEKPLLLNITYMLQRTINDELMDETKQNYFIIIISYSIMFLYISLSLGKFYDCVRSNFLLSFCGMFYIIGAVYMSYATCGFLQIKASLISLEVIPFLILAIGVDNMFFIYHSIYNVPTVEVWLKVSAGLRNIGVSVTLSALTQIATFACGLYIGIPALETFCMTAIFALTFNYLLQMSVWPALIAIDLKRKSLGYLDLLPFVKTSNCVNIHTFSPRWEVKFFKNTWKKFVLSKICKVLTFLSCLVFFVLFIFALVKLPSGLDQQLATIKDGNLYNYFGDMKKYIEVGPEASIIIKTADYDNPDTYKLLDGLMELLSKREGLAKAPYLIWYRGVNNLRDFYVLPEFSNACFKGVEDINSLVMDFDRLVQYYLTLTMDSNCCKQFGICGGQFYDDIVFQHGLISSSKINFFHGPLREQIDFINALNDVEQILDFYIEDNKELFEETELKIYPYSLFYVFFEQYNSIKGITIQNYILAMIFLFTLVSILFDLITACLMVVLILLISSNIWSIIWIFNYIYPEFIIEMNGILLVNFIISIGIAVEFCIHSIIRFRNAKGSWEEKRTKIFEDIIPDVFRGIFLTKLIGLSVLYFSPIPLFVLYYFRVYYIMILVCGFYGLIVTPIFVDTFGSRRWVQNEKKESFNHYLNNKKIEERLV